MTRTTSLVAFLGFFEITTSGRRLTSQTSERATESYLTGGLTFSTLQILFFSYRENKT